LVAISVVAEMVVFTFAISSTPSVRDQQWNRGFALFHFVNNQGGVLPNAFVIGGNLDLIVLPQSNVRQIIEIARS